MSTKIEAENIVQNLLNGVNEVTGNKDTNLTNAVNVLINSCDLSDVEALIGNCELVEPGEGSGGNSGGSAALNIHYGDTEPTDTSMLWCKCEEPATVEIVSSVTTQEETKTLSATMTNPADCVGVGVVGTKCYLFGGQYMSGGTSGSWVYLSTIQVFDTDTNTIRTLTTALPTTLYAMGVGVVGKKIYLFGGHTGISYENTIYVFDTETESIEKLTVTLPNVLAYMGVGVVGKKIYLFGGLSNGRSNTIYSFDTDTNTVETLTTTLPNKNRQPATSVVGNKIYLFGGNLGLSGKTYSDYILVFDTETDTIETLTTTLPTVLHGAYTGTVGRNIYLLGGYNGSAYTNTIMVFDSKTHEITTLSTTLTDKSVSSGSGVVGNKIYMFGGVDSARVKTIRLFVAKTPCEQDEMIICTSTDNIIKLLNGNDSIKLGLGNVYHGNSVGYVSKAEYYLYKNNSWVQF